MDGSIQPKSFSKIVFVLQLPSKWQHGAHGGTHGPQAPHWPILPGARAVLQSAPGFPVSCLLAVPGYNVHKVAEGFFRKEGFRN
jgi:hypothetical protein